MPEITIREVRGGDEASLWAILEPVIREGTSYPLDQDTSREQAFAYWFAADKRVFVATDADEIVGTYYLKPNSTGPAAHVANAGYIVHPAARGRGVARAMAEDSLKRAKALGFHAMQFNLVVSTNTVALRLWQAIGMQEVGRLPQAFCHPQLGLVDAVVMYRLL